LVTNVKGDGGFLINKLNYPKGTPEISNYDYLIQKDPLDTLFTLPYILIQIQENGRLSKSE